MDSAPKGPNPGWSHRAVPPKGSPRSRGGASVQGASPLKESGGTTWPHDVSLPIPDARSIRSEAQRQVAPAPLPSRGESRHTGPAPCPSPAAARRHFITSSLGARFLAAALGEGPHFRAGLSELRALLMIPALLTKPQEQTDHSLAETVRPVGPKCVLDLGRALVRNVLAQDRRHWGVLVVLKSRSAKTCL